MNPKHINRRLQMQIIFAFMPIFSLVLILTSPDPNRGQLVFRIAMAAIGVIGFAIVSTRRTGPGDDHRA